MRKQTIEVDLGEIEQDWEAMAFRVPKSGDMCLDAAGRLYKAVDGMAFLNPRLIVRRKFVWPSHIDAAAICMDKSGDWWIYETMPEKLSSFRSCDESCCVLDLMPATCRMLGIELPDNHDWTVPLINPNYKESGDE